MILLNDEKTGYIISIPEHGIYQPFDPTTGNPFTSEADAEAYQMRFLNAIEIDRANYALQRAAEQQAEQAAQEAKVVLDITTSTPEAGINYLVPITARLVNGIGTLLPVTRNFIVPIQDSSLNVVKLKSISFVNGVCNTNVSFDKSGYYLLTEAGINSKLVNEKIYLDKPFEVTIFE